jgi:hypothetical protein
MAVIDDQVLVVIMTAISVVVVTQDATVTTPTIMAVIDDQVLAVMMTAISVVVVTQDATVTTTAIVKETPSLDS